MPLGGVGSSRQALSEDQRRQIIAKLLSERRSQSASAAGRQQAALPEEERAARLQELINRRAAAKQQQGTQATAAERQQALREPQGLQHRHQQQQHRQHQQQQHQHHQELHQHQHQHESQLWQQQQQQHSHVQQQQPQRVHPRPASVSSIGSSHYGSCSQDPLLSPGSTNSLASGSAAARVGATHHQHHQHHHRPPQQQQQQLLQRPAPHVHAAPGRASSPDLRRHSGGQQHRAPPQQQLQQQQRQQVPTRPPQQQQQRGPAGDDHVLRHVLEGPVDISDLWASRASLTEATSLDQQGLQERARPYHTHGTHHSSSSRSSSSSSRSSSDGGSTGVYDGGSYHHAEMAYGAAGRHSGSDCWLGSSYGGDGDGVLEQYSDVLSDDEGGGVGWRSGLQVEVDGRDVHGPSWELSGALSFTPAHHLGQHSAQQAAHNQQQQQQRLQELRRLQQELQEHRQQHGSRPTSQTHHVRQQQPQQQQQQGQGQGVRARPSPPAQPRHAQQPVRAAHLPSSYPLSRSERLQQLAQPKVANRHKYEQMKAEAEQQALQQCSFTPKTGRGPQHRCAPPGTVGERLYKTAAEKKTRLEQKAVELANSSVAACTFQPQTNASANARVLESYEYVPLHKRLGQVMRSRSEKLAHIQQQVEAEVHSSATFAPRINPRSSVLASMRRSRSCSRLQQEDTDDRSPSPARGRGCDTAPSSPHARGEQDVGRSRSRERTDRMRRTRSEAGMSRSRSRHHPNDSSCTFAPSINAHSQALLQASGEIPLSFLQRQEYFDRLAREKKQLLQLAVEDQHCSFGATAAGTRSSSRSGRSDRGLSVDQESFLDRIERLAYTDKRRLDASRSALADVLHNSECTFRPAINPRSARMAQATPLDELYSNSKGRLRRDSVALALELQHEAECTFSPNLHKPGVRSAAPPEAKLSLSAEEVACVVERLYPDQRSKEARVGEAASYQQYKELKHCTFTPEINRDVPRQQGPVLVRGLGRFLELKDMARQAAEAKAAVEAKVFITQPKQPTAPFTTPQPFRLGPEVPLGYEARRRRAQAEAEAATMAECTFKPRINSHHKTRQERVAELLARD